MNVFEIIAELEQREHMKLHKITSANLNRFNGQDTESCAN